LKLLQEIPYDSEVEAAIGDTDKLLLTALAEKVKQLSLEIIETQVNTRHEGQQGRKKA
jgi:Leu/Phe-tRNA-protein transferase